MGTHHTPRRGYRIAEVAYSLGVSERTVRAYITAGLLDAVKPTPRCVLVLAESLDALLSQERSK